MLNSVMCLTVLLGIPGGLTAGQTTLRGTVVDSVTGKPIGAVRVVISPADIATLSANTGAFVVGPVPPGQYEIQFETHRYQGRAFVFGLDSLTAHDYDLGRLALSPADSLLFDIGGFVGDAATAIPGATVSVNDRLLGITGPDGAFVGQLRLPTGLNVVHARAMGFAATTDTIWLERLDTLTTLNVTLQPLAVRLPDVVVEGEGLDPKLAMFDRHRRRESGRFLYGEALESARGFAVTDMLRSIPGVRVTPGANTIRLSRAPSTLACAREQPQFFVDGRPMRLGQGTSINDVIEQGDVVAVEVYNGAAEVPVVYNRGNAMCGVVALWTR